jgi:hypothetical protein
MFEGSVHDESRDHSNPISSGMQFNEEFNKHLIAFFDQ